MRALRLASLIDNLPVVVFTALPIVGLVAGPSFAALIFGLGIVQGLYTVVARRTWPQIDHTLMALAAALACLAWASIAWSIVPDQSWRGALQITAIFVACVVVLGNPLPSDQTRETLAHLMPVAFALGAVTICADAATGYHLQSIVAGGKFAPPTKYNQGAIYLVLVAWPLLAQASHRRDWRGGLLVAASMVLMLAVGPGVTGRIAAAAGAVVRAIALIAPRIVGWGIVIGSVVLAGLTPVLLHSLAENRAFIAAHLLIGQHLSISGLQRLELWDYMTAGVFQRPFLGWGLWSAKWLPISLEHLSRYYGNYPHNQWLQLWIETGAVGPVLALGLVLVVVARTRRSQPQIFQPFAYAALATGLTISVADFQITTDSWWAALVASAYLFRTFGFHTAREHRFGDQPSPVADIQT
jgi:O-antigen ligase